MQHPFDVPLVTAALARTGLFDALDAQAVDTLLSHCEIRLCPPGEVVLHEGQPGDALYVVLEGALQVFRDLARSEVVLARVPKGGHVGEQALLPGGARRRTASVRAAAPTVLLRLPREPFLEVVARSEGLAAQLRDAGRAQLLDRVAEHGALARALTAEPDFEDAFAEVERAVGEKLIVEGAPADALYLITKGFAEVYRGEGAGRVRLARLSPGQCVGELGLVHRRPRAASVVALSRLQALRIDGDWFTRRYAASPALRAWIGTLESAYRLADRGFVTTHGGSWVGRDTLTSVYHLPQGRQVTVTQVVGEAVVDAQTASAVPDQTLVHEREGARRTLMLQGDRLVGLDAIG
ncbi:MAG: cyclic nucleotide-binding domain-containing protein, partial [Myxococcales bacterium]|nr:cyclic nucleotide-binding domain-containing protein [Myxococcales bacterium]